MHVAIDGVGNHVGGGWSVLERTVRAIADDPRIERVSVFCSPLDLLASPAPQHPKLHWIEHGREHRSPRARLAWFSIGLDSEVDRVGADVVVSMNAVGRTARPRVCVVQQAFTVWGKLAAVRPRQFAAKLAVLRRETARSVAAADAVVVQTSWMRTRVYDTLGRDSTIVPLGLPAPRGVSAARAGYQIAVVGSDLPYKRRDIALKAVELAQRRQPLLELTVVDDVAPAAVELALSSSAMLLVPSDVESFGLPIVEAFASGCPIVLTDKPWARAVADNAASYFDAGAVSSAARRLVEGVSDVALLDDLRARGRSRLATLWRDEPYTRFVDVLEGVV